jgi:hypothetical protein
MEKVRIAEAIERCRHQTLYTNSDKKVNPLGRKAIRDMQLEKILALLTLAQAPADAAVEVEYV